MDEAGRVSFREGLASAVLTARLLIESDVVVLFKTARPIQELRCGATLIRAEILKMAVPTLPQQTHMVIYALTKLTSAVEGRQ